MSCHGVTLVHCSMLSMTGTAVIIIIIIIIISTFINSARVTQCHNGAGWRQRLSSAPCLELDDSFSKWSVSISSVSTYSAVSPLSGREGRPSCLMLVRYYKITVLMTSSVRSIPPPPRHQSSSVRQPPLPPLDDDVICGCPQIDRTSAVHTIAYVDGIYRPKNSTPWPWNLG